MFLFIFAGMILMGILERIYPHYNLPYVKGWIGRAVFFNMLQLAISVFGYYTWEHWIASGHSVFHLDQTMTPLYGGLIAYFINTWIFYWWHRLRHDSKLIWLLVHQFHHSPQRIEIITSFYKHPIEIMLNSIIISILVYPILGLSVEANAWLTLFSAMGEFVYHINVKTPHWLGYFIQRPESHCLHHIRDKRNCCNHADLPIWDILGGTFCNPAKDCDIGFSDDKELNVWDMMLFRDVVKKDKRERSITFSDICYVLFVILTCLSAIGYVANSDTIRGIGFATAASPLPFVFSAYNGEETFSTTFELHVDCMSAQRAAEGAANDEGMHVDCMSAQRAAEGAANDEGVHVDLKNGSRIQEQIDHKLYGKLKGPYNRRNVYGAIFSHGPFFDKENLIEIRQQILEWGLCGGFLSREFGINEQIEKASVIVTQPRTSKSWEITIEC